MDSQKTASTKPDSTTKTQRAYLEAFQVCLSMKRLTVEGKRHEIVDEVKRQFKKSQQFHFYKLATEFAADLQHYYYNVKDDEQLGAEFTAHVLHYDELSHFENIVTTKSRKISHQLNKTRSPDEKLIQDLRTICFEFESYLKYDSATIWVYAYSLLNALAYIEDNHVLVIQQSYDVIKFLEERGIDRSAHFYKDMTPALIRMGRYDEATAAIEKAIQNINKGSSPWSVFLYYRVVIALHRRDYENAYRLFLEAEKKRHINKAMLETWKILRGYIKFLILSGKIEGTTHFLLGKFLNDIEVFSRDKSGQSINVIILKIVLRLQSGRDKIIDEREAIKKYRLRHLEKGSRAEAFFLMLHQLVPGDFQKAKVKSKAAKYQAALPKQKGYNPDLEIIPFEHLWEMILEQL